MKRENDTRNHSCQRSSGKKRSKPDQRRIIFADYVTIRPVIRHKEYSSDEKTASWYTAKDIAFFKQERITAAKEIIPGTTTTTMVADDSDNDDTTICTLGLEGLTPKGARQRKLNIVNGINSVLDEQELQYQDGVEKPDMLAFIYKLSTKKSTSSALKRARRLQETLATSA